MIKAEIIADSKNEFGNRITTFVLTFPRIILAELNTHRMFSRNSASSRAIPFEKMLKRVEDNPFIPIAFQKDHKGMQGTEYWSNDETIQESLDKHTPAIDYFKNKWLKARDEVLIQACHLSNNGATKQLCNRLLEPFMWHTAIVTATEYENFFHLRCPQYSFDQGKTVYRSKKDACLDIYDGKLEPENKLDKIPELGWFKINKGAGEIHIMALAEAMWDAMNESRPKQLKVAEWHIPFGGKFNENKIRRLAVGMAMDENWVDLSDEEYKPIEGDFKIKIATARCARVSYINYEGKDDYEADIKLHDRLVSMGHWSPFEHCARAMTQDEYHKFNGAHLSNNIGNGWSGNFKGFVQYRKMFEGENKL